MSVDVPQKIAFVAMPFGIREVSTTRKDAPKIIDFDSVWSRVLAPVLEELGYMAVRADEQAGSVIIKDMLEQLLYADLVIADISIDNANVYYEAGIRHAAQSKGCVLIGADWAEPVFDLAQIRQIRYPYEGDGLNDIGVDTAKKIIKDGIEQRCDSVSPVYDLTPYPEKLIVENQKEFVTRNRQIAKFQKSVRMANIKTGDEALVAIKSIESAFNASDKKSFSAAQDVYSLLRDKINWQSAITFIQNLPDELIEEPFFQEQYALAIGKKGEVFEAIDALEVLINEQGKTPERLGLLGGRYKSLYYKEENTDKAASYLDSAIESYKEGMWLNLNEYYCSCNLPRLLRARDFNSDAENAKFIANLVVQVCEYRIEHGTGDGWEYPSLLGASFDTENIETAKRVSQKINAKNITKWSLETTISDLYQSVSMVSDEYTRSKLEEIIRSIE